MPWIFFVNILFCSFSYFHTLTGVCVCVSVKMRRWSLLFIIQEVICEVNKMMFFHSIIRSALSSAQSQYAEEVKNFNNYIYIISVVIYNWCLKFNQSSITWQKSTLNYDYQREKLQSFQRNHSPECESNLQPSGTQSDGPLHHDG